MIVKKTNFIDTIVLQKKDTDKLSWNYRKTLATSGQ